MKKIHSTLPELLVCLLNKQVLTHTQEYTHSPHGNPPISAPLPPDQIPKAWTTRCSFGVGEERLGGVFPGKRREADSQKGGGPEDLAYRSPAWPKCSRRESHRIEILATATSRDRVISETCPDLVQARRAENQPMCSSVVWSGTNCISKRNKTFGTNWLGISPFLSRGEGARVT